MSRVANILLIFVAVLLISSGNSGQAWALAPSLDTNPSPTKFDYFGSIRHCDLTARLDNLAIQIQNTPGITAAIMVYGPKGGGFGSGKHVLRMMKEYLVNTRGIEENRIATIYGGGNADLNEPRIELWIVPKGVELPRPVKHETNLETFEGLLVQEPAGDGFGMEYIGEDGMGYGIPATTDASFAEVMGVQKKAVGYIVVYSGNDLPPGAWRNVAQQQMEAFKALKVDSDRVKVIYGGRQEKTSLQLWIQPKDAPPPVAETAEAPLTKSVSVGDFYAGNFDKQNQKNFLKRLAETLQADKTARAFIVVRLEQPVPEEPPAEGETPVVQQVLEVEETPAEEEPEVDLTQLVEKFRLELMKEHRIAADRITVLFTTAPEAFSTYLSLWIVPKGAPLPDPNENEAEPEVEAPADPPKRP